MTPLPRVVAARLDFEGASVSLEADPFGRFFGAFVPVSGALRLHASPRQRADWKTWKAIQKERKRLGLPPLTSEEMEI